MRGENTTQGSIIEKRKEKKDGGETLANLPPPPRSLLPSGEREIAQLATESKDSV